MANTLAHHLYGTIRQIYQSSTTREWTYWLVNGVGNWCKVDRKSLQCDEAKLRMHGLVSFTSITPIGKYGVVHEVRLLEQEIDPAILKAAFLCDDKVYMDMAWKRLLTVVDDTDLVDTLAAKIRQGVDIKWLLLNTPEHLMKLPQARPIREALPAEYVFKFYESLASPDLYSDEINNALPKASKKDVDHFWRFTIDKLDFEGSLFEKCPRDIKRERADDVVAQLIAQGSFPDKISWLKVCLATASIDARVNFFIVFWKAIKYEDPLFQISPEDVKQRVIRQEFAKELSIVETWPPKSTVITTYEPKEIYGALSTDDRSLANNWASYKAKDPHVFARMLSARGAEKTAVKFYKSLGYKVTDVSISQIKAGNDEQWKICDLLLDDSTNIDVKNARKAINSNSYVEHVVPRFKLNRSNNEVVIFGVLSPYLQKEHIEDLSKIPGYWFAEIQVLGETSFERLNSIAQTFSRATLEIEPYERNVIPSWAFDFPPRYYSEYISSLNTLRKAFSDKNIDSIINGFHRLEWIQALTASGIALPDRLKGELKSWQVGFCEKLVSVGPVTLPVLFLAIIDHFLRVIEEDDSSFEPKEFGSLLYTTNVQESPLGLSDPLHITKNLIKTLSVLWANRTKANLTTYKYFKFKGLGILQGKRYEREKWTTLLAYCGGQITGKGKCGHSPLVIGREDICPSCGYLICPMCGSCKQEYKISETETSPGCPQCTKRMQEMENARLKYATTAMPKDLDFEASWQMNSTSDPNDIPF